MAGLSSNFYVVFWLLVVDLLAFTVILPLLPSILDYYDRHDEVRIEQLTLKLYLLKARRFAPRTPQIKHEQISSSALIYLLISTF